MVDDGSLKYTKSDMKKVVSTEEYTDVTVCKRNVVVVIADATPPYSYCIYVDVTWDTSRKILLRLHSFS